MAVTKKSLVGKGPTKPTAKPAGSKARSTGKLADTKLTASKLLAARNGGGAGWVPTPHH